MAGKKSNSPRKARKLKTGAADSSSERVKRPELPRTEPIRSWSTLFGADGGVARAQSAYASGARATTDAVQRGVEVGYRVVDEYLRQGSAAADAFAGRGRQQGVQYGELPQMAERMMRSAQDFSSMWFDMMGALMSNMPGQPGKAESREGAAPRSNGWPPGPPPSAEQDSRVSERWRVIVRMDSVRPTEVTVTLNAGASAPVVEPLRAAGADEHIDASLELVEGGTRLLRLDARVPAHIAADRYTGAVLDASTGASVGRVTVAIFE